MTAPKSTLAIFFYNNKRYINNSTALMYSRLQGGGMAEKIEMNKDRPVGSNCVHTRGAAHVQRLGS